MLLGVAKLCVLNASTSHISPRSATRVRLSSVPIRALFLVSVSRTASAASAVVLLSTLIVGYPPKGSFPRLLSFGVRRRSLLLEWFRALLFRRHGLRRASASEKHAECPRYRKPPADRRRSG